MHLRALGTRQWKFLGVRFWRDTHLSGTRVSLPWDSSWTSRISQHLPEAVVCAPARPTAATPRKLLCLGAPGPLFAGAWGGSRRRRGAPCLEGCQFQALGWRELAAWGRGGPGPLQLPGQTGRPSVCPRPWSSCARLSLVSSLPCLASPACQSLPGSLPPGPVHHHQRQETAAFPFESSVPSSVTSHAVGRRPAEPHGISRSCARCGARTAGPSSPWAGEPRVAPGAALLDAGEAGF